MCARARLQRRGGARRKVELWPAVGCSGKSACATKGSSGHFVYKASESKGKYVPTCLIEVVIRKLRRRLDEGIYLLLLSFAIALLVMSFDGIIIL